MKLRMLKRKIHILINRQQNSRFFSSKSVKKSVKRGVIGEVWRKSLTRASREEYF